MHGSLNVLTALQRHCNPLASLICRLPSFGTLFSSHNIGITVSISGCRDAYSSAGISAPLPYRLFGRESGRKWLCGQLRIYIILLRKMRIC